ncbi:MAG: metallophosphoesterase [Pseudomonadales bacterium]|nr:metallophosphoesterase [Pseudomonadales bacterium]
MSKPLSRFHRTRFHGTKRHQCQCILTFLFLLVIGLTSNASPDLPLKKNGLELRQIPPYFLLNNTEKTVISWVSTEAYKAKTLVWNDFQQFEAEDKQPTRFHKMVFTGLHPQTEYRFKTDLGESGEFTTPVNDRHTRFTTVGHTGGTRAIDEYPVQTIFPLIGGLDSEFTLLLGDFCLFASIDDCKTEYFDLFRPLLKSTTVIPAPGNHEKNFNEHGHRNTLDNFRNLFPYHYPQPEGENAYYSFTYKNIRFYSVTLTKRPMYMDRNVLKHFEEDIKKSNSDFNIVFWGAENRVYDDEHRDIFRLFNKYKVDAIFGGADGGQFPWRRVYEGVPYYFAGSLGSRDRQFFYVDINDYYMKVRVFNAAGEKKQEFDQYARKTFKPQYTLDQNRTYRREEYTKYRNDEPILEWYLDDIPSQTINGIVIDADCFVGGKKMKDTVSYLHWVSEFPGQGEAGMNRLPYSLKNQIAQRHVLRLPENDPYGLKPYKLNRLALRFANCDKAEKIVINEAYIF